MIMGIVPFIAASFFVTLAIERLQYKLSKEGVI